MVLERKKDGLTEPFFFLFFFILRMVEESFFCFAAFKMLAFFHTGWYNNF